MKGVLVTIEDVGGRATKANGSPTACESWGAALAITEIDKGISRGTHHDCDRVIEPKKLEKLTKTQ
jgi:hypothetical protein